MTLMPALRSDLSKTSRPRKTVPAGRVPIRPQTLTRKNALFAGSDGGGRTWATIATLLATARLNNIDPQAWLALTLERIANGWPNKNLDALMPWNHAQH